MKKINIIVIIFILLISSIVASGYAYFSYVKNETVIDLSNISTCNSNFDSVNNEYYKVYFFASPYYATGAEINGNTITDALTIADSSENPYNSDEEYMLIGASLRGNQKKYANVIFDDNVNPDKWNYHYITYKSRNENIALGEWGAFERFTKKDYTGFIRKNKYYGIEQTSKYVSLTVKENLSSEQLSNIMAGTEFKDKFGFGPEFIGWTYDIETTKARTMYNGQRYTVNNSDMKCGDTRGWGAGGKSYQLGNFGCQGEIEQITPLTSLRYIDNLTDSKNSSISIDGSKVGDKIIYLYPVFVAKNYSEEKSIDGVTTSIIKFRINSDYTLDEDNCYLYGYKQESEIDFAINRYTVCLFQKSTKNDYDVNYYINNMYISTNGNSRIDTIQLDVSPANGNTEWCEAWTTIISYEQMKKLNLDDGYYNIDITFIQLPDGKQDEEEYSKKVTELSELYWSKDKYCQVYTSKQNSNKEKDGIDWLQVKENSNNRKPSYYVIGFQKIIEYRVTGKNGSIDDFYSSGSNKLYTTSIAYEYKQFYETNNISLKQGDKLSILIDNTTSNTLPYKISSMPNIDLNEFNTALDNSNYKDKNHYNSLGENGSTTESISILGNNKIVVNEAGNYNFIFNVEYVNSEPVIVNVGYRKNLNQYYLLIFTSKPSQNIFCDYDEIYALKNFLVGCEHAENTILGSDSIMYNRLDGDKIGTSISTIGEFFDVYSNYYELVDTATNMVINRELFDNKEFYLNRNYIVYMREIN